MSSDGNAGPLKNCVHINALIMANFAGSRLGFPTIRAEPNRPPSVNFSTPNF